jgi:hypothetical protein
MSKIYQKDVKDGYDVKGTVQRKLTGVKSGMIAYDLPLFLWTFFSLKGAGPFKF